MKMTLYFFNIFILLVFHTIKTHGFEKSITHRNECATIIGLVPKSAGIDSVRLILYHEYTVSEFTNNITGMLTITSKVENGKYYFNIPVNDKILYFSLYRNNGAWPEKDDRLLNYHLVEKEDFVVINHLGPKITFSGVGAAKHTLHFLFSNEDGYEYRFDNPALHAKMKLSNGNAAQNHFRYKDTFAKVEWLLKLLTKRKPELSESSYQLLYCEIIGTCQYPLLSVTRSLVGSLFKIPQADKDAVLRQFKSAHRYLFKSVYSDSITASSIRYTKFYLELIKIERALSTDTVNLIEYIIKSIHKGELRDKLLISTIGLAYKRYGNLTQLAIDHMHSPALINKLEKFHSKQEAGARVVGDFSLKDLNNSDILLSSYKGKVIFLDFWYVGCAPCVDYYKTTVAVAKRNFINSRDVIFITVCTEKDYNRWIAAIQTGMYTSQSAVNLFTGGVKLDHPLIRYFNIVSAPTPILINKKFEVFSRDEFMLGRGGNPKLLINTINLCIKSNL